MATLAASPAPIAGPKQAAWFRALDHARMLGVKPTYHFNTDSYTVRSPRAGDVYAIHPCEVDGQLVYECECPAGSYGNACWHAALVAALPGEVNRRTQHAAAQPPIVRCAICDSQPALTGRANCAGCQSVYGDTQRACRSCGQVLRLGEACSDCFPQAQAATECQHVWEGRDGGSDYRCATCGIWRSYADPVHERQTALTSARMGANVVPFARPIAPAGVDPLADFF
jgi:hypothetical protein